VIKRPEGAQLKLAPGFHATEFLADFKVPRFMLLERTANWLVLTARKDGEGCVWIYPTLIRARTGAC